MDALTILQNTEEQGPAQEIDPIGKYLNSCILMPKLPWSSIMEIIMLLVSWCIELSLVLMFLCAHSMKLPQK